MLENNAQPRVPGAQREAVTPLAREYLTTSEAAALLRVTPKTLRNKVAAGIFVEGRHYFRKRGLGPRWKRATLVLWLEGLEHEKPEPFALAQPGGREVA